MGLPYRVEGITRQMSRSLSDWLNYLETIHPQTIRLGLERVNLVAKRLNLTEFNIPVVTIAGTNGKGSCTALLEAIWHAAGFKVGVYTSPHLIRFNERIRINNKSVSDESLCEAFSVIEEARAEIDLTYFEFTTLAALYLFKQANLSAIILEVGLGGCLDATNIVDADVAVISSISFDHMEYLGSDLASIAKEKAGIIKAGSQVVNGDIGQAETIQQVASSKHAQLWQIGKDYGYQLYEKSWEWWSKQKTLKDLPLPHLSEHNAAIVLMVVHLLQNRLACNAIDIQFGLNHARLAGRFQTIYCPQYCILDVAHNPASSQLLAQNLRKNPNPGRTLAVVSILGDKDLKGTLQPLTAIINHWYVGGLKVARGISAEKISQELQQLGVKDHQDFDSVEKAFIAALQDYQADDRIVVFGSFYSVASVLKLLQYNVG